MIRVFYFGNKLCLPKKRTDYWPVTTCRDVLNTFFLKFLKVIEAWQRKNLRVIQSFRVKPKSCQKTFKIPAAVNVGRTRYMFTCPNHTIYMSFGWKYFFVQKFFLTKMIKIKQFCLISIIFKNNFTLSITRIFKFWLVWNIFCMFCVTCTKLNLEGVLDFNIHWGGSGTFVIINSKIVFSLFLVSRTVSYAYTDSRKIP